MVDKFGLNDDRLSFKAKGILVYLLSKPNNWKVSVADLVKRSKEQEKSVRAGLKELTEYGYLVVKMGRDSSGKFGSTEYIIHEKPVELPYAEKGYTDTQPYADKRHAVKRNADKEGLISNDLSKNDLKKEEEEDNIYIDINSESYFFNLIAKRYKIDRTMTNRLLDSLVNPVSFYKDEAIERTFKKSMNHIKTIIDLPSWFSKAIENEQFQLERSEIEKEAFEKSKAKYGGN